jgi:hypothetical protein
MAPLDGYLVHYTHSTDVLLSILENGFLLVPNKRNLINALLGQDTFLDREPQQFGMVSFTQLPFASSSSHRQKFGRVGIVMSWEWAAANNAQRVVYVDEQGPTAESLSWLFRYAKQELDDAAGGNPGQMALENAAVASFANSTVWSHMLRLYEYMEPERNSPQVEWRIVNTSPQYHQTNDRSELIQNLLKHVKLWKSSGSVRFEANDVIAFICPREEAEHFTSLLPEPFRSVPVKTYRCGQRLSRLRRAQEQALWSYRGRERVVKVLQAPPKGTSWLWVDSAGAFQVPTAEQIRGARLHQDELRSDAIVLIQYYDVFGRLCDLLMRVGCSFALFDTLEHFRSTSGLHPSNYLPQRQRPRDIIVGRLTVGMRPRSGRGSI